MTNTTNGFNASLLVYDLLSSCWTCINEEFCLSSRGIYGHSGHILNDDGLVTLVGGVWEDGEENNGFVILSTKEIHRPLKLLQLSSNDDDDNNLLMLINHDSVWIKDKNQILIVGGGGNCFSFGTLLNAGLTFVSLPLMTA